MARIRAYFKVDLYFFEHPKVVDLSHTAVVLFLASIAYANRRETDGFIARPVVRRLIEVDEQEGRVVWDVVKELVQAGLWEETRPGSVHPDTEPRPPDGSGGPGGWWIHGFLEDNESNEERAKRREADAARKREERGGKGKESPGQRDAKGSPKNVQPDTSGRPSGREPPSEPVRPIEVTEHRSTFPSPSVRSVPSFTGVGDMPVDNRGRGREGKQPRTPRHPTDEFVISRARQIQAKSGVEAARAYVRKVGETYGQASKEDQLRRLDAIIAQDAAEAGER